MSEEETPQERLARLKAKSTSKLTKPKPLYEALQSVSVADYMRLRVLVETLAEWDLTNASEVLLGCPWCNGVDDAHNKYCPVRVAAEMLKQLPPAMPMQLPPRG